jgi:uncharacterized protein YwqG
MAGSDAADRNAPTDPWAALRADLRRDVVEAGLGRHAEALLSVARPALRLVAENATKRAPVVPATPGSDDARRARRTPPEARIDGSTLAFGRTRLGGVPDVPDGFRWPTRQRTRVRYGDRIEAGAPLSFVAQINLAELPPVDGAETQLPTRGMLWFFYDARFLAYDADDADGFRVVYSEAGPDDLRRAEVPEGPCTSGDADSFEVFDPVVLAPRAELSLPSPNTDPDRGLGLPLDPVEDEDESEAYYGMVERWDLRGAEAQVSTSSDEPPTLPPPVHRVMGWPFLIQNDNMEAECEVSTRHPGVLGRLGDAVRSATAGGSREDQGRAFERAARDSWQLLLQVDSDDAAGMMWGDSGLLYFWIRKDDLAARRFERVWCAMQCC